MGTGKYKRCKLCGKEFTVSKGNCRKYCSDECRFKRNQSMKEVYYQNAKEKRAKPKMPKMSINDILRWANEHKQKTGVYLDYAKAREQMKKEGYPV